MFPRGYWGEGYWGKEYWPPVVLEEDPRPSGGGRGRTSRTLRPVPSRDRKRREEIERQLKAETRRQIEAVPTPRLDLSGLERAIRAAKAVAPPSARKVIVEAPERFIVEPAPLVEIADDDFGLRLLLLLGW